jgi:hypothetical protein
MDMCALKVFNQTRIGFAPSWMDALSVEENIENISIVQKGYDVFQTLVGLTGEIWRMAQIGAPVFLTSPEPQKSDGATTERIVQALSLK